jgi:SAM-dependent methyltransferase
MSRLYEEADYYQGEGVGYDNYREQEKSLKLTFERLLANLRANGVAGGSLLELGCGFGYLLAVSHELFSKSYGTEYSNAAIENAAPHAEKIFKGGLDAVPSEMKFDCIIANQVLEHAYNPGKFISDARKYISAGGFLVLAVPDLDSPLRYLMGRHWPSFKIPEHVLYFNAASLKQAMLTAGFTGVRQLPYPHAFPASLIARKFRVPLPAVLQKLALWIPGTTVACVGQNPPIMKEVSSFQESDCCEKSL